MLGHIFLAERLAARDAAVHQIIAVAEADRRDADLGEREMVGTVEMAGLGMRIGAVVAALLLAFRDEIVEQAELRVAGDGEVLRRAPDLAAVGVDHAYGFARREQRVLGIIFGAEQALFLGRNGEEDDRAIGPWLAREGARLLEKLGDAGRIVERAIIDRVAALVGLADAEMVPVGRIDHGLVGIFLPGQIADDIVRNDVATLACALAVAWP